MNWSEKRVLIVDDDENNCLIMKATLRRAGFEKVDTAHDGVAGYQALSGKDNTNGEPAYDAVLLDVMLPKTNGFELCMSMRNRWGDRLAIILVTGYRVEDYHARYIESGADDFLSKPIKSKELVGRLSMLFKKRSMVASPRPAVPKSTWSDLRVEAIGQYTIVKTLSWSGPVMTYEARLGGQRFVVKLLTQQAMEYDDVHARFLRERDLLRAFNHRNLTSNYGSGTFNGLDYFVNEFVEGKSLHQCARRRGTTMTFILDVAKQVADALAYVHSKGVIHRDLKLRNIFVDTAGTVKIGDFGIALVKGEVRLTQNGFSIGTPIYMAPEQADGHEVTPATDVYSFGANMYHFTTGLPPFSAGNAMTILRKHAVDTPRPMSWGRAKTPAAWNDLIVNRCMAKDPRDRPESMAVVRDEVAAMAQEPSVQI